MRDGSAAAAARPTTISAVAPMRANPLLRFRKKVWLAAVAVPLLVGIADSALAQQAILAPGNAAVTGFSGALPPAEIAPGVDPGDLTFIDAAGPSLRIVDLQHMGAPPAAQLVGAPKPFTWFANQIGQVFGVATDDASAPNIYVAATSAYGLPIVAPGPDGKPQHVKTGAPGATFMPALWGSATPDGGPGSIWKIDGTTAAVTLFANVTLDGRTNSGAALGGLAYDPQSKSLFVADRETGLIHRFGMDGTELGRYDQGVTGRQALGLPPLAFDPARHLDITSPNFDTQQPATWNYAAPERRVFGLAVFQGRLYYAVAEGLQIWSVGIAPDGSLGTDATIEVVVPPAAGPTEISKITFDEQGRMFLAERAAPTGAYDFEALTPAGIGRVLRYALVSPTAPRVWQKLPDEYAIGFPLELRNANGGVAIGYRYDAKGDLEPGSCGGFVWSTGEDLRDTSDMALAERLKRSGPPNVDGLQGNETWRIRRDDGPPLYAYFIDYDDKFDDTNARGHMGDLAIVRACTSVPPIEHMIFPPPAALPPGGLPGAPPHGACPPNAPPGSCKPPPPSTCPPNAPPGTCPPTPCPPGEVRGRRTGQCQQCSRPNVLIGGTCCTPADLAPGGACVSNNPGCPAGQTAVGPSNACCPDGQIYTDPNGAQACCLSGQPINGECPPPPPTGSGCTPSAGNPNCSCPSGYTAVENACCLSSQVTSTGICCPSGEAPSGPNKSQCEVLVPIPIGGPSCCKVKGQIPAGPSGACCDPANVSTLGQCCSGPVTSEGNCPVTIQSITKCAPGYTRMPDNSCCNDRLVSPDGKSCNLKEQKLPPANCAARGRNFVRNPNNPGACVACGRGQVANDDHTACIKETPRKAPPRVNCAGRGSQFVRDPRHPGACIVCGRGLVANETHTECVRIHHAVPPEEGGPPPGYGAPPYYGGPRYFGPGVPGRGGGGGFGGGGRR